ncbi:MAG: hypothetical protein ABH821_05310 [archaeon]
MFKKKLNLKVERRQLWWFVLLIITIVVLIIASLSGQEAQSCQTDSNCSFVKGLQEIVCVNNVFSSSNLSEQGFECKCINNHCEKESNLFN